MVAHIRQRIPPTSSRLIYPMALFLLYITMGIRLMALLKINLLAEGFVQLSSQPMAGHF